MTKKWWQDKIAYQIYPKSFLDSNGDGIGDIQGIISKLDYLKDLGIDIVWLSPIYCSPLADQGYDISDYYNIDPRFGTLEDFDELIKKADERNIKILMDLVVNHCSDEHVWFKKACENPDSEYGKYFYIVDYKAGDPLPTNWRSYFGGSCWDFLPGHKDKMYLHLFHKKQPDLNWENPALREEIYKMMNFWLDKGLGGFRIDAIINIKKSLPFKNYEPDRNDGLVAVQRMIEDANGIDSFLTEMSNRTFKKYDAFSVGEVFNSSSEELNAFIGENGYFSSMFDFAETIINTSEKGWFDQARVTPEQYKRAILDAHIASSKVGFLSNIIENHDEPRGVSHYIAPEDLSDTSKKMLAGIYFLMPGIPFIYQGQEIGMENYKHIDSIDDVDDCSSIDAYNSALSQGVSKEKALDALSEFSRDNSRSPFQWNSTKNAGFTTATPWLKVNENYTTINLEEQINDEASVYNFYKKLISLRKNPEYKNTLIYGDFKPFHEEIKNFLGYSLCSDKNIYVLANYQNEKTTITLPNEIKNILISNLPVNATKNTLTLAGYQIVVVEI